MSGRKVHYDVILNDGSVRFQVTANTQMFLVLECLISAGDAGVTALEVSSWALRMSEYVRSLRHDYGLAIDTVREEHIDRWGKRHWHGRYILLSTVHRVCEQKSAA